MKIPIFENYIQQILENSTVEVPAWNIEKIKNGGKSGWNYIDGCMILSLLEIYCVTGDEAYYAFADAFVDWRVEADGTIKGYSIENYNIDDVNMGKTLFLLYEINGKEKYRKAIDLIYSQLQSHPRTRNIEL